MTMTRNGNKGSLSMTKKSRGHNLGNDIEFMSTKMLTYCITDVQTAPLKKENIVFYSSFMKIEAVRKNKAVLKFYIGA